MKKYADSTLKRQTKEWLVEYIHCLEKSIESCEESNNRQFNILMAMDREIKNTRSQLEELEKEHPYKIVGQPETYSQYNEGWSDCIDRVMGIWEGGQV